MTADNILSRAAECEVFSRYLIGAAAGRYVKEKYADAHEKNAALEPASRFEHLLVSVAAAGAVWTRLADSYARMLAPQSALRKKLALLLALLECSWPEHERLDKADDASLAGHLTRFLGHGMIFLVSFLLAAVLLLPAHVALGLADTMPARGKQ